AGAAVTRVTVAAGAVVGIAVGVVVGVGGVAGVGVGVVEDVVDDLVVGEAFERSVDHAEVQIGADQVAPAPVTGPFTGPGQGVDPPGRGGDPVDRLVVADQ